MQENAKDENDKTAVDWKIKRRGDICRTVELVKAGDTVMYYVAALSFFYD